MRKQIFTVEIITKERDGCGNGIPPLTEGAVRKALANGLDTYDSICVQRENALEDKQANAVEREAVGMTDSKKKN